MYEDANRIQHESYDAACHYYGVDTPAQVAAEMAERDREDNEAEMDAMVAAGGTTRFAAQVDDLPF